MRVDGVTMVYDADGGLRGEVSYLLGTLRGRHCSLCDITHSGVRRKRGFDDLTCSLPVPVEVVHRNEQRPALARFTSGGDGGAVVVADTESGFRVLMDDAALRACGGDVDEFGRELRSRLSALMRSEPEEVTRNGDLLPE